MSETETDELLQDANRWYSAAQIEEMERQKDVAETLLSLRRDVSRICIRGIDNGAPLVSLNTVLSMIDDAIAKAGG